MTKLKQKRTVKIYECLECGETSIKGPAFGKHVKKHGYKNTEEYKIKYGLVKTQNDLKNEGAVRCEICEFYAHDLNSHIIRIHKMKIDEYKKMYNGHIKSSGYLNIQSERMKGKNNPAYQHNGKYSPFSDKFIYADKIDKQELCKKVSKSNRENGNNDITLAYWTKRGYTEEQAKEKISEKQSTFSLEKCMQKYGEETGRERWLKRQEKWHKNYKKSNFSKISQELFWKISHKLNTLDGIYFAQLNDNKQKDDSGRNWEYNLKLNKKIIKPDFFDMTTKKIIEFDGDYWHDTRQIRNTNKNREFERDKLIAENGYIVLHVKECDYKDNPENVIKECMEFLNG